MNAHCACEGRQEISDSESDIVPKKRRNDRPTIVVVTQVEIGVKAGEIN